MRTSLRPRLAVRSRHAAVPQRYRAALRAAATLKAERAARCAGRIVAAAGQYRRVRIKSVRRNQDEL